MRIIGLLWIFLAVTLTGRGQTDVNISHRYLGRINYNPAATGSDPDAIHLQAFFREQWIGFDRAPSTQVINIENYFRKYNSGGGIVFLKDEIGFSKSVNFKATYAYHVKLNHNSYVSLGLSLGLIHNNSDGRNFNPEDPDDPNITYLVEKETMADFDVGIEYHWKSLNVGIAVSHITKSKNDKNITPHTYGYVNYAMNVDEDWRVTPSLFAAVNHKSRIYEMCVQTEYRSKINVGVAYRVSERLASEAVIGLLGITVSDYVRVGYSYDFTIGQSSADVTGAHELMMSFRMKKKKANL